MTKPLLSKTEQIGANHIQGYGTRGREYRLESTISEPQYLESVQGLNSKSGIRSWASPSFLKLNLVLSLHRNLYHTPTIICGAS